MWPTLWFLLIRRRIASARLVFLAVYLLAALIPYTQSEVTIRPAAKRTAPVATSPSTPEAPHE
jgi:hypothetical protein